MSGRCTTIRVSHRSSSNVGHEESATAKETRKLRRRRRPRSAHGGAQCAQDRADVRHADLRLGERKGRRQEAVTGSRERRPAPIWRPQGSLSARGSLTSLTVVTLCRRVTIYFCESTPRRGGMYELEIRRATRLSRNIGDHEAVSRSPVRLP